jgi:hypothetical protein
MTETKLPPNELADLYEAFYTMREWFPENVDPLWELAIESILFGGVGLADGNSPYGEQQAEQNNFKIGEYRSYYGDGERVTEFPAIATREPSEHDRQHLESSIRLPVAPKSKQVLPLDPKSDELVDAFSLLNEFPTNPGETNQCTDKTNLLDPTKFPGLSSNIDAIKPNELADLCDCLRILIEQLPDGFPEWKTALETVWQQTEYMSMSMSYGQQTIHRNTFAMDKYRAEYGDGERVTEFPAIKTSTIHEDSYEHLNETIYLPIAPESNEALPALPGDSSIPSALSRLQEFPAWPQAELYNEEAEEKEGPLLDVDSLLADSDLELEQESTQEDNPDKEIAPFSTPDSEIDNGVSQQTRPAHATTDLDQEGATNEKTILRKEEAGEQVTAQDEFTNSKYADPQAEEAHRRAQQRDPSDVVELGERISLVLKEVDYTPPATIMGTKNSLVVFVTEAPQDLSKHDTVRVKIIDYGGKNNSAEAVFVDYDN